MVLRVPQTPPEESVKPETDNTQAVRTVPPGVPNLNEVLSSPVEKVRVISHTTFREPLLDEGSVEIETYTTTVVSDSRSPLSTLQEETVK